MGATSLHRTLPDEIHHPGTSGSTHCANSRAVVSSLSHFDGAKVCTQWS
jgi:hypothetical protein